MLGYHASVGRKREAGERVVGAQTPNSRRSICARLVCDFGTRPVCDFGPEKYGMELGNVGKFAPHAISQIPRARARP